MENMNIKEFSWNIIITIFNVEQRFESLFDSPVFESIESVLDTCTWPIDGDCGQFGNKEIDRLVNHYKDLLNLNACEVSKVSEEWLTLKAPRNPNRQKS